VPCRSISVQTEEIRVDQRINLLPKHLQPSTISSTPPSPSPSPEPQLPEKGRFSPISIALPPRNPKRMKSTHSIKDVPSSPPQLPSEAHDTYPGNNDDGPLANSKGSLRRPHRSSSLFAGFEGVSSDEADDFADADLSDSDFRTALSAPKPKLSLKAGKRTSVPPTSVPEDVEPLEEKKPRQIKSSLRQSNYDSNGIFTLPDAPILPAQKTTVLPGGRQLDKPLTMVAMPKSSTMRRAALISNGIAAHQGRSRSPSLPEAAREPPFPIPTRASSRKPPFSISAPSDGNRSPTRDSWGKHARRGSSRGVYRANSIRKVRSAAAIPANAQKYRRHGSRSPPPLSASTEAPESPQLPPMPTNDITSPELHSAARFGAHRQQPSTNTAHTSNTGGQSIGSTQATSVVDAIAQTMVGEWMFKYVRRRKSFGVPDNGGPDGETGANGVRHKRWVWLAPYERAVMWSSKQPTSGSALMGKSGRKRKFSYDIKLNSNPFQ
jgi:Meiotic cell cortex C-terminal pleckstrin homology